VLDAIKICSKCGWTAAAEAGNFPKRSSGALGSWCRACCNDLKRKWRENPENKANQAQKRKARCDSDEHRARERERQGAARARWARSKQAKKARPKRDAAAAIAATKATQAKANRKRRSTPEGILNNRIAANIYQCLRRVGDGKRQRRWEALVGYTVADLRQHLERQFVKGMSWDNAGEWHVDHIIPQTAFSFTSAEDPEFRACWALSNLRPLWRSENISKHAKRLHLI